MECPKHSNAMCNAKVCCLCTEFFCRSIAIAGGKWEELEGRSYEKQDNGVCSKPVLGHSGDNDSPIEMVGCADSRKWAYNILRYTTS